MLSWQEILPRKILPVTTHFEVHCLIGKTTKICELNLFLNLKNNITLFLVNLLSTSDDTRTLHQK